MFRAGGSRSPAGALSMILAAAPLVPDVDAVLLLQLCELRCLRADLRARPSPCTLLALFGGRLVVSRQVGRVIEANAVDINRDVIGHVDRRVLSQEEIGTGLVEARASSLLLVLLPDQILPGAPIQVVAPTRLTLNGGRAVPVLPNLLLVARWWLSCPAAELAGQAALARLGGEVLGIGDLSLCRALLGLAVPGGRLESAHVFDPALHLGPVEHGRP